MVVTFVSRFNQRRSSEKIGQAINHILTKMIYCDEEMTMV